MTTPLRPLIAGPGYEVTQPGGTRAWLAEAGVVIVEDTDTHVYRVTVPDLAEPVLIDADEIARAAAGVPNLIAARIHYARIDQATVCPWHPDSPESDSDPVGEQLAAMLATALTRSPR